MNIATLTIVEIQDEGKPPSIYVSGELPLQRATLLLQNFLIEAAKEAGRAEAVSDKVKLRQRDVVTSEGGSKKKGG